MNPSIDDRLASVVRALSEVILPHLPPEASLAQEQAHLAIGHIQIIRAQLDQAPAFEREELDDAITLGKALCEDLTPGNHTGEALAALRLTLGKADGSDVRGQRHAINQAIQGLIGAVGGQGCPDTRRSLSAIILDHEHARTQKDRKWFAAFGFDTL